MRKAVGKEFAPAQSALGDCYGKGEGVKQNHKKAQYWYQKAAEQKENATKP